MLGPYLQVEDSPRISGENTLFNYTECMSDQPRFLADAMLARLARWLRVLNYDTRHDPTIHDPELVQLADEEDRWLLTRDRALVKELRPTKSVLITRDDPLHQLTEVVDRCELCRPDRLFLRCLVCNTPLREATNREINDQLPPSAENYPDTRLYCPQCHRLYWPGSHTQRMTRTLKRALPDWFDP